MARKIADIANAELLRLAGGLVMAERNVHERGRGGRGPGRRPGGHLELLLTVLECQHGILRACISLSNLGNEPSVMLRDKMPHARHRIGLDSVCGAGSHALYGFWSRAVFPLTCSAEMACRQGALHCCCIRWRCNIEIQCTSGAGQSTKYVSSRAEGRVVLKLSCTGLSRAGPAKGKGGQ